MSCSIPANAFETRQIKAEIHGDYFNNTGAAHNITFRGKLTDSLGTDTITGVFSAPSDLSRKNFVATLTITPTGVDTQTVFLAVQNPDDNLYLVASWTRKQGEQLTLDFTAQLDAADPDLECRRFSASVQAI